MLVLCKDLWYQYNLNFLTFYLTDKNCYTKEGHTCMFPFKYGGKEYSSCYSGHGGYWCPYSVTSDGTYNDWDWCDIDNCSETNQI